MQKKKKLVDEPTCCLCVASERVTCTTPTCGGLRRVGARVLSSLVSGHSGKASCATPSCSRLASHLEVPLPVDAGAASTPSLTLGSSLLDLPSDHTQRVSFLHASTMLYVLVNCRLRMISAVTRCWNDTPRAGRLRPAGRRTPTTPPLPRTFQAGRRGRGSLTSRLLGGGSV